MLAMSITVFFASCSDDDDKPAPDPDPHSPSNILKVNSEIVKTTYDGYLWNDKLPSMTSFKLENESDPITFFEKKLRYDALDKWSYVTDEAKSMFDEYKGISTTYGYGLSFGRVIDTNNYFAIVDYVYSNSPAQKAGIERGDILLMMDGKYINADNAMDLYNSSSITLELAEVVDRSLRLTGEKVSMQAIEMDIDAVNAYRVIEKGNKKIGYICYTDFTVNSETKLTQVFSEFKSKGATDIILDLRCNRGGAVITSQHLAGILVPEAMVESKDNYFLAERWNENYDDTYLSFKNAGVNMGLQQGAKLYVLTSPNTASASEAVIVGLKPYLDVVTIGDITHGKYCGAALLQFGVDSKGKVTDEALTNWAISLIVFKFVNKDGLTDFKDGLAPTYKVEEDWTNLLPFGHEDDPLVAKALELITGKSVVDKRSVTRTLSPTYQLLENQEMISPLKGGMNKIVKGMFDYPSN